MSVFEPVAVVEPCYELQTVRVCMKRLRAYLDELGAMLLADQESRIMQQVHAVSSVEDSIFMESSLGPRLLEAR